MGEKIIEIVIKAKNLSAAELEKARRDIAGFKKDTEGATGTTSGLGSALRGASSLAGIFGVALSAAGLVRFGKELLDDADATVKLADKLGMSVTAVQDLKYIAEQSGNTLEQLTSAVSMLQKRLGAGDDSAIAALKGLGIEVQAFQQLTPDEQFMTIAREVAKIEDPVKRVTAATNLFGKSGAEVLPSLIAKVDELRAAAPKMSKEAVYAFDAIGDGLSRLWTQTKNVIGEGIAKALTTTMDLVERFKSAWVSVPGPLKEAGAAALVAAGGLWALNAASGALVKTQLGGWALSAAGGIKTLGAMTMAFGWQGFGVTLGGWVAPLTKIGAALTAIPGGLATVGAALGAVVAAAGVSAVLGEKGYDGLRKGIESLIGPSKAWLDAQQKNTGATTQGVDAEARFMDAAVKHMDANRAHASLLDTIKTKQSALADELGRFTNETLTASVKAIRTNETAFNAWAESQHLSKEAIAFLTAEAKKQEEQEKKSTAAMKEQAAEAMKLGRELNTLGLTTRAVANEDMAALQKQIDAAAKLGAMPLEQALIALLPDLEALAKKADASGVKVDGLQAALDRARSASTHAGDAFTAWELSLPTEKIGDLISATNTQSETLDTQAIKVRLTTDAYHAFGLKTPDELRKVAAAAEVNYRLIAASVGASAPAAVAAYKQMVEAQIAVTGELPKTWATSVLPGIKNILGQLQTAWSGTFAQMMLGAKGFKDGFLDIWASLKASVVRIFAEIADAFLSGLLKRMLAGLAGNKAAFAGGFSSLFAGMGSKTSGGLASFGSLFTSAGGAAAAGGGGLSASAGGVAAGMEGAGSVGGGAGAGAGLGATAAGVGAGAGVAVGGFLIGKYLGEKYGKTAGALGGAGAGAATGAAVGSVVPVLGTAIGALVGGVAGLIGGLMGASKAYKDIKQARAEFEGQFGGSDAMIKSVSEGYAFLGKSGTEAEAALKNLWQAKDIKAYDAAVRAIVETLGEVPKKQLELAIAGKQQFFDDRAVMNWQTANELAEKYGGTLASLGTKFEGAKLQDSFKAIWDDYQTLIDMNADAGDTFNLMSEKIGTTISEALRLGTEVPEQFKSFAQTLLEQGRLFDENGVKMTDLSRIKFGAPIISEVDKIVAKMDELIETLRNKLTPAIKDIPTQVRVKVGYDYENYVPPEEGGGDDQRGSPSRTPGYATGALITREHMARVGEGGEPELIGPVGFMGDVLARAIAALGMGRSAPTPTVPEIVFRPQIVIDGRQVAEAMAPYLPAVLKQYGLVRT